MDDIPPVSTIVPLPQFSPASEVQLQWSVTDTVSQPYNMRIEASTDQNPVWQYVASTSFNNQGNSLTGTATYQGKPGATAYFRIHAVDKANNAEPQKTAPDASTRLYQWKSQVNIVDAREHPLQGVQVQITPSAMNQPISGSDGQAAVYWPVTGRFVVNYQKNAYAALPPQNWSVAANTDVYSVLTGKEEKLLNGHFDTPDTPLAGWQSAGNLPAGTADGRFSGQSARLGSLCNDMFCFSNPVQINVSGQTINISSFALDPQGRPHIHYQENRYGVLDETGNLQPWPNLPESDNHIRIKFDQNGAPYILTRFTSRLIRWTGSAWTSEATPLPSAIVDVFEMDGQGQLHVLHFDNSPVSNANNLLYTRRNVNGSWTLPIKIPVWGYPSMDMAVEANGTVHIVYDESIIKYLQIKPDGTKTDPVSIVSIPYLEEIFLKFVPNQGLTMVATTQLEWQSMQRSITGNWTKVDVDRGQNWANSMWKDNEGNIYVMADNNEFSIKTAGEDHFHTYTVSDTIANFSIDLLGQFHLFRSEMINNQWVTNYRRGGRIAANGVSALDQLITLPMTMNAPTLSFFYRMESPNPSSQSRFQVTFTPTDGQPVVLFDRAAATVGWTHAWADLTPHLGQTGTLSLRLNQSQGEYPDAVYMDEVSVAAWPTLVVTHLTPHVLDYPLQEDTWVDLYGANLPQTAQVFLGDTESDCVEWISSTHLRFQVPASQPAGVYTVRVSSPGGDEARQVLYIGSNIYLPNIGR